ncbi:sulfotransferase, partial [Paraglaciecola sp.]|uniref:tetratricopeptide repeat-containing sulfotransferase family protein n=1 Tax=Paraglaciecola sp. TaxID=1920173 RepID=UPI003EF8884C
MIDVRNNLKNLVDAVKLGDTTMTREHLKIILSNEPKLGGSWLGVARMALLSGEVNYARKALHRYKLDVPKFQAETLPSVAMLIESGDIQLAYSQVVELLAIENKRPEVNHFASSLALQLGKKEEAVKQAELVLNKWPNSGEAWLILVNALPKSPDTQVLSRMLLAEESIKASKNQMSKASFYCALSKAHSDAGDDEAAFRSAELANQYQSEISQFNFDVETQLVQNIRSSSVLVKECQSTPVKADSNNPIFVLGLPRSGTTLLEQLLCGHSQVINGGEFNGMERAVRCLTKGQPYGSHSQHFDPNLINKYKDQIRQNYLTYIHQKFGQDGIVVDKSLNNNRYLGLIKTVFPESPVILINRGATDTAWSCFRTHFSSGLNWSLSLTNIAKYFVLEEG